MSVVPKPTPENILMHLRNVFSSGELDTEATTKKFLVVRKEGKDKFAARSSITTWRPRAKPRRFSEIGVAMDLRPSWETSNRPCLANHSTVREGKAANLLYFVVKDHPFTDGNRRIGALLFHGTNGDSPAAGWLLLRRQRRAVLGQAKGFLLYLVQERVAHSLDPRALTALTLLIAESAPVSKELMIRLVVNLLAEPAE